jgi:hypothetical protein
MVVKCALNTAGKTKKHDTTTELETSVASPDYATSILRMS